MLTLGDILECFTGRRFQSLADDRVREVIVDSRKTKPGDVFVALPGAHWDGNDFAREAIERGASLAIVDLTKVTKLGGLGIPVIRTDARDLVPDALRPPLALAVSDPEGALQRLASWWRNKFNVRVIGVTGSIGKTTSKELIAQVLGSRYSVLKSEGNMNNALGVPLTLLRLTSEHQYAVLEMGMDRLGEIASYCAWAAPQVGVVTMVGPVHLEKLGSMQNIAKAKAELVQALPPAELGGRAILNDDDDWVSAMATLTQAQVVTYGLAPRCDVWADNIESEGLSGVTFTLHHGRHASLVRLKLLGRHSVHTALRAAAVALYEGMSIEEVVEGLNLEPAQLRLLVARGPFESLVLDDTYNASPESTLAALNLLKDINGAMPRIAVLGDMFELGDAEQRGHEEVGCRAALVADLVVCVGERSKITARAARECGAKPGTVVHVNTNVEAIEVLSVAIRTKSVVLVKGSRGMRMEEIVSALGGGIGD